MDHIKEAIRNVLDKNLQEMKENFSAALSIKAVEKLEERKVELAKSYLK